MENKNSVGTLEENKENLLEVHDLWVEYRTSRGAVKAVNGLNLNIAMGETLGLVGETGAGKSTTAFGIMRILPDPPAKITGGEILYKGRDLLKLSAKEMRDVRGEEISMIFQDPMTSLDPVKTVGNQIQEMIELHTDISSKEAWTRAEDMLEVVGIKRERANDSPHQFSGGMKQRVVIAIALASNPEILICDEPTTALDVTIQARILELINDMKRERDLSVIFITHDLGVVANMADRGCVMYAGRIVEVGTCEDIFYRPAHPYTWALLSAMPDLHTEETLFAIPGAPPNMLHPPKGDAFAARNKYAMKIDFEKEPPYFKISDTHYAATWLLHPDAPKVEMPDILKHRIARMREEAGYEIG